MPDRHVGSTNKHWRWQGIDIRPPITNADLETFVEDNNKS